jgi:nucleoside-diphosphate-sugar epimerase
LGLNERRRTDVPTLSPKLEAAMNGQRARGRRGRPVVAVTRAATLPGAAVTAALAARVGEADGPRSVVAVDDRRGTADGAVWRITDVTSPGVAERLAGADVVVHVASPADLATELALGSRRREQAVRAAQAVATAAAAVGVRRLVVLSSAMVYGALPDNRCRCRTTRPCGRRWTTAWSVTCSRWSG